VPTMFIRLLRLPKAEREKYDVSSLTHVVHAAAPCPPDVKQQMIDWFGPVICEFYGGTETGPVTFATSADAISRPGTVGRCVENCRIEILDQQGELLPAGSVGDIYSLILTYPEFTYQKDLQKRRDIERRGLVCLGDVGYLDKDGYLFISDRRHDVIISGGVNIYSAEVEAALLEYEDVQDCVVFGIPDPEYGEAVLAYVEPISGHLIELEKLNQHLRQRLASFKIPKRIEIQAHLPREDTGKIFKRKLREPHWVNARRNI